jgi:CheY-like chemotaxis protein/glycine cleavage system H lipoate-binding protein
MTSANDGVDNKIKILVVDDEQIVLDSVCKHLVKENYEVSCVLSAAEALKRISSEKFDIVLTDLMMPETDGLELMKLMKDQYPLLPVIMITGYATINTALQATQLGAFDYIAKPFSKVELKSVVKRAAELVQAAAGKTEEELRSESPAESARSLVGDHKHIGDHCWMTLQRDGNVLLGVDHSYLNTIGRIQTVYLPRIGDELRQGSVFLQIFTTDMKSHPVLAPLSGHVVAVNEHVHKDPTALLDDPYGEGWLIKLKPSRFEHEIEVLGL